MKEYAKLFSAVLYLYPENLNIYIYILNTKTAENTAYAVFHNLGLFCNYK